VPHGVISQENAVFIDTAVKITGLNESSTVLYALLNDRGPNLRFPKLKMIQET
jgi:hypothetical protein